MVDQKQSAMRDVLSEVKLEIILKMVGEKSFITLVVFVLNKI